MIVPSNEELYKNGIKKFHIVNLGVIVCGVVAEEYDDLCRIIHKYSNNRLGTSWVRKKDLFDSRTDAEKRIFKMRLSGEL